MVNILNESPVAHPAESVVLLCILIPLDVVLFQSYRFHIFAVVCPLDSFHTVDCVIMLLVVLCTEFSFFNSEDTRFVELAFCPVLSFDPAE